MTVSDGIKGICQYVNAHKNRFKINDLVRIIYLMLNQDYIYTVLYQTLTSHFVSLASGLML